MNNIYILGQITGTHGPCADSGLYSKLVRVAYPNASVREVVIKREWEDYSFCKEIDDVLADLEKIGKNGMLILLGADWHSQVLHKNQLYKARFKKIGCRIVSIFQETFLQKQIIDGAIPEMKTAQDSAVEISDICIYNHWPDYQYRILMLRSQQAKAKCISYMPFLHPIDDLEAFQNTAKEGLVVAIGSAKFFSGDSFYFSRALAADKIRDEASITLIEQADYIDAAHYYNTLCRFKYHLVLPSITSGLTARQVETCACGTVPIIPKPSSILEQQIYADNVNCLYYNPFNDISEQVNAILGSVKQDEYDEIRRNAINTALSYSVNQMASYFKAITMNLNDDNKQTIMSAKGNELDVKSYGFSKSGWRIAVDLVFFQLADTGIAKVWEEILNYLAQTRLRDNIILFQRRGSTLPSSFSQFETIEIEPYNEDSYLRDVHMLDNLCEQYDVSVFASTYLTYSGIAYNLSMIHDCIPERVSKEILRDKSWLPKINTISQSDIVLTVSDYSAKELQRFYPAVRNKPLIVAKNTLRNTFIDFDQKTENKQISKKRNACLLVGTRMGWRGYKNGLAAIEGVSYFCQSYHEIDLLLIGGEPLDDGFYSSRFDIEDELCQAMDILDFRRIKPNDQELKEFYSQSICLLFLSEDEGYGLPLYECLLSGGRVIVLDRPWNNHVRHPNLVRISSLESHIIAAAVFECKEIQRCTISDQVADANKRLVEIMSIEKDSQGRLLHEILELALIASCSVETHIKTDAVLLSNQFESASETAKYLIERHPANISVPDQESKKGRVAMLTSLYNANKYVDQLAQDINFIHEMCQKGIGDSSVEHIIIDSCSPTNEAQIFKAMLNEGRIDVPFIYYRTPYRESLYKAWNRSILLSRSEYLSNANADDTHSPYFAICAHGFLSRNSDVMLAYPDQVIEPRTSIPYIESTSARVWGWPEYSYSQLLIGNHVGSTPIWRRCVHNDIGLFNSRFTCAGDWEFWLRIATNCGKLGRISLPISQYFFNPKGIEHGDPLISLDECTVIQKRYGTFGSYEVSDNDLLALQSKDSTRSLEDMQYSGIVHESVTVYIIDDVNDDLIQNIISIHNGKSFPQVVHLMSGHVCITPNLLTSYEDSSHVLKEVYFYISTAILDLVDVNILKEINGGLGYKHSGELGSFLGALGLFSFLGFTEGCHAPSVIKELALHYLNAIHPDL